MDSQWATCLSASQMQEHIQRLNRHIEQGTLIRGEWVGTDASGRETACLLAAMVPQCGEDENSSACPATIMPSWLAHLTPNLEDKGSLASWPGMVQRFAGLAARWHVLDAAAWQRIQFGWLAAVVREAASHAKEPAVTAICERVAALCDGVVTTGVIDAAAFDAARKAAWNTWAAWAAAWASAEAAWAAAWAAWAAAWADAASAEAAWDRMTAALFDCIEKELV